MNEKHFEAFDRLIDEAFSNAFKKDRKEASSKQIIIYESIDDYTAKTGKRFRMTKEQKNLGLTREEAFNSTYGGSN